ncbi:hypothetical protein K3552_10760 [Leisingera aquaemixtae]|uniref:hypothetical protein n=1 Tax=Leisingera aquaemixtae TaxID=1396826 RepID=UPI0021A5CE0D|nr:hypothetical protein [Leisingera aquaemixtae]UWQ36008.1 hypothetical protein K3552_10760 [Leisingera aquaemixtae]
MLDTTILMKLNEDIAELKKLNGGTLGSKETRDQSLSLEYARLYARIVSLATRADIELDNLKIQNKGQLGATEFTMDFVLDQVQAIEMAAVFKLANAEVESELKQDTLQLSQDEISKLEDLIAQARKAIRISQLFSEKHKTRLLRRLEKIQLEIHKKAADLDVALAALVEIGEAVGDAATKAEPAVGFIERIVSLFNSSSGDPLQLPPPPKQIEDMREDGGE